MPKILGMGLPELIIILVVILLIFGPRNLPKLGNAIGRTVKNLRSGMEDGDKKKDEGEETVEATDEAAAEETVQAEEVPVEKEAQAEAAN
ncbi:MAG: twin-arginine translocase TatA/TatE family subunit [Coriobacteriaceae bacterium]|nr:twin-arginine translocase TatA/TatE family subunit [Coriobacteriaceae bacterium]